MELQRQLEEQRGLMHKIKRKQDTFFFLGGGNYGLTVNIGNILKGLWPESQVMGVFSRNIYLTVSKISN